MGQPESVLYARDTEYLSLSHEHSAVGGKVGLSGIVHATGSLMRRLRHANTRGLAAGRARSCLMSVLSWMILGVSRVRGVAGWCALLQCGSVGSLLPRTAYGRSDDQS
jgi:hypothetical protein